MSLFCRLQHRLLPAVYFQLDRPAAHFSGFPRVPPPALSAKEQLSPSVLCARALCPSSDPSHCTHFTFKGYPFSGLPRSPHHMHERTRTLRYLYSARTGPACPADLWARGALQSRTLSQMHYCM